MTTIFAISLGGFGPGRPAGDMSVLFTLLG